MSNFFPGIDPSAGQVRDMEAALDLITICIPVYNDWDAVTQLLRDLDSELACCSESIRVLIVDDSSQSKAPPQLFHLNSLSPPRILRLRRNLGHQRAIAVALCQLWSESVECAVLVMDGDGQDTPQDACRLIERYQQKGKKFAVFAERKRRAEGLLFRMGYWTYRVLHRIFTGIPVKVGNFSILPWEHLGALVVSSELWSHYAAAVFKCRLAVDTVSANRSVRQAGRSRMNFIALVVHGLSAVSVFADVVGVRMLCLALLFIAASGIALLAVTLIPVLTGMAVPGQIAVAVGILLLLAFQAFLTVSSLTVFILHGRNSMTFVPIRNFESFIESITGE